MSFSASSVQNLITATYLLVLLVLPLGLMFWAGKKLEPVFPPAHSPRGIASRLICVGGFLWLFHGYLNFGAMYWKLDALEHLKYRALALERVQKAGGWQSLTEGCDELLKLPQFYNYDWHMGRCLPPTDLQPVDLPPALAALRPQVVSFTRHSETNWSVNLKLIAGRRPNYGLRVMCIVPSMSVSELPPFASPPIFKQGRQLAERVYEF